MGWFRSQQQQQPNNHNADDETAFVGARTFACPSRRYTPGKPPILCPPANQPPRHRPANGKTMCSALAPLLVMCLTHHQHRHHQQQQQEQHLAVHWHVPACHPHPHNVFVTFRGFPEKKKILKEKQNKVKCGGS